MACSRMSKTRACVYVVYICLMVSCARGNVWECELAYASRARSKATLEGSLTRETRADNITFRL